MRLKIKNIIVMIVILTCTLFFLGCGRSLTVIDDFNGYDSFLNNLSKYDDATNDEEEDNDDNNDDDDELDETYELQIDGFSWLTDEYFDFATPFYGDYAFAIKDEKMFVIDKLGHLTEIDEPVNDTIENDKYIFENDSLFGVKSIFGQVIIEPKYLKIQINDNVILAKNANNEYSLYINDKLSFENVYFEELSLAGDEYLLSPYGLFDFSLKPVYATSFRAFDYIDGVFIINDGVLFGIATLDSVLIEPKYLAINYFCKDYAIVADLEGCKLINLDYEVLFFEKGIIPISFDGEFLVYSKDGWFGVMDSEFNDLTGLIFPSVVDNLVYFKDYIITFDEFFRVYSLSLGGFYDEYFYNISYYDDCFIAKNDDGFFTIYNSSFYAIEENLHYVCYQNDVLLVAIDGEWRYYVRHST